MWSKVAIPLPGSWPKLELIRMSKIKRQHQILGKTQGALIYNCVLEVEVEI